MANMGMVNQTPCCLNPNKGQTMFEPTSIFDESNDESVLTRIQDDDGSQIITIFHAPHDVLGEDGPIITQIADDTVFVIFSDEYIQEAIGNMIEINPDQTFEENVFSGIGIVLSVAVREIDRHVTTPNDPDTLELD
jgi:hypothetical protein